MLTLGAAALGAVLFYLALSLLFAYLAQELPRRPVHDPPDWGRVTDTFVPARGGGRLEVWRVDPEGPPAGVVLLAHGWGRNRDRMVRRAAHFGRMGFATVIHSARDHGGSSRCRMMNAVKMAEDIEAVMDWVGEAVLLYGHSAGAGAAAIVAARRPERVRLLFLEAAYADTEEALLSLYRWFNRLFGVLFGPMIVFWMNLWYRGGLKRVSPAVLAPAIRAPVLLIHGARDRRFPLAFAERLRGAFPPGQCELFVSRGAGHSDSSLDPGYPEALRSFIARRLPAA